MKNYSPEEKKALADEALELCCSGNTPVRMGGRKGRAYWNPFSSQFMYVPAFQFQVYPGCERYLYTAVDEKGGVHTFESEDSEAALTPVWKEIPEGVVELKVEALSEKGERLALMGARTFFKLASFPADLPEASCSYREAAIKGLNYAMNQPILEHWLENGMPDPTYDLYVYPSKMEAAIIGTLLRFAKGDSPEAKKALAISVRCADYLLSISFAEGPLKGLPPTYYIDFRDDPLSHNNLTAEERLHTVMMLYPATVGKTYLKLEKATGDRKYYEAAMKIAEFYRDRVLPCGSWHLILSTETGEPTDEAIAAPLESIVPFLMNVFERTGDPVWRTLADNAIAYVELEMLERDHWEGQFEDSSISVNYSNLTHYCATALAMHYANFYREDAKRMKTAEELLNFAEDQFVIWKRPAPWNRQNFDTALWRTPCALEQYVWYVPIDASTANLSLAFLTMYKATGKELYLAKARALADQLTRVQQPNGLIPTHWMDDRHVSGEENFWLNCMFSSMKQLLRMAELQEES